MFLSFIGAYKVVVWSSNITDITDLAMEESIRKVTTASNPYAEVFKIRKRMKRSEAVGFPLKDSKGNLQVDKHGIDGVINQHFVKVFSQLEIHDDEIWKKYWRCVDEIYSILKDVNSFDNESTRPDKDEIFGLIRNMNAGKSVNGDMTIDLVKLGGEKLWDLIYRCICWCYETEEIPIEMRIEKMILLYKNAGEINLLDNYRGIFLRHVILSILQKWLYSRNAAILDMNGSELAFGGRVGRSVQEALLIVKLIQDHAMWTGERLYLKFMDVQKFFDTMNFRKALIDAYNSGLKGKDWKLYDSMNKFKTCIPSTPLGTCSEIIMNEVFVQGSTDAVLMAWNTMDDRNKKERENDNFKTGFVIEGIAVKGVTFIDDILEFARANLEIEEYIVDDEVFQRSSRLRFKPSKCKILLMNAGVDKHKELFTLNQENVEVVLHHKYLGTMVSDDGTRKVDFETRVKEAQGGVNEIVQVCKSSELSPIRLKYVNLLLESCLGRKVKFGCEMWDILNEDQERNLDNLKVKVIKRAMELPYSTPSVAVKYEFGLIDFSLEIQMEKVLLAVKVLNSDEGRVAKQLLQIMLSKRVPGFCTQVVEICETVFGVTLEQLMDVEGDLRTVLKEKLVDLQRNRLRKQMITQSKTDGILLNSFKFDGKRKKYLDLPFPLARIIFMVRCRMILTKDNFPGRWEGTMCNVCKCLDTVEHLFKCPGFSDLIDNSVSLETFYSDDHDLETMEAAAVMMGKINDRLKTLQEL